MAVLQFTIFLEPLESPANLKFCRPVGVTNKVLRVIWARRGHPTPGPTKPEKKVHLEDIHGIMVHESIVDPCHSPPCYPSYTCPYFTMPTSKSSIVQRHTALRAQLGRELILATLKDPSCWDACWRPLLLIHVILSRVQLPSLEGHPYIYERWWSHDDSLGAKGVELKLIFTNAEGSSMVLLGTIVWRTEEESSTARWVLLFH